MSTLRPPAFFDTGPIHFVGMGGIGMSGIAELLLKLGCRVQGSDMRFNSNLERLRDLGAQIHIGHAADNIAGAGVVVMSSAIGTQNVEIEAARYHAVPVIRRADMLGELMRLKWTIAVAGTHGKTTTTSMIAALLDGIGHDPSVINGGIMNAYGSNAKLGQGDWMVVEADESDGTFTRLRSRVAVVTNIDAEHMDHYGGMQALRDGFCAFLEMLPFYGFAVLCSDHPEVRALATRLPDRRLMTYGLDASADVRADNVSNHGTQTHFDLHVRDRSPVQGETMPVETWPGLMLPMAGEHNLQNALAAIAVARGLGGKEAGIRDSLARFSGVKRRFSLVGEVLGAKIIDDYAHHPVEIAAVLKAARDIQGRGRVLAVVQPHRYSRLKSLFDEFCTCFDQADHVWVVPVHSAGEPPIEGGDHNALARGLSERGHPSVTALDSLEDLPHTLASMLTKQDMVVCMGAGSISQHATALADAIESLHLKRVAG